MIMVDRREDRQMTALFHRSTLLLCALVWVTCAAASTLSIRPLSADGRFSYGTFGLIATLTYDGPPCPADLRFPRLDGTLSVIVDGVVHTNGSSFFLSLGRECFQGTWTAEDNVGPATLDIGAPEVVVEYTGEPGIDPARSSPLRIEVLPDYSVALPASLGTLGIGLASIGNIFAVDSSFSGPISFVTSSSAPSTSATPPDLAFPYGYFTYRIPVGYECFFLCPPLPPIRTLQTMQLQFPARLPSNASVWSYAPTNQNPSPAWQLLPARIEGRLVTITLEGGLIGGVPDPDHVLRGTLAVSMTPPVAADYDWVGMWWGGPGEDGWGLSLSQSGDHLFGVLYVYDDAGEPAWLALSGTWDPARSVFNAHLFRQRTPAGDGEIVGTAALSSASPGAATLEYDIGGMRGSRQLQKMASALPASPFAGAWDEVPLGGGLTIHTVGDSLFVGWPSYEAGAEGRWLVMPSGEWTAENTFEGVLYRTHASPWVGLGYDARSLRIARAGSMTIKFSGADNATLDFVVDGRAGTATIARHRF
jgi:hypothetical protein